MIVYALAFFSGWLRGLGWKRLLLRSDNERALLVSVSPVLRVWKVLKRSNKQALKGITQRSQVTDSSAEESSGRETQETAGLE